MHVSHLLPILLNIILSEQQKQKPILREQITSNTALRPQQSSISTMESETAANRGRPADGSEPLLLPLPLKTPLFPDTQFFIFRDPGNATRKQGKEETGIIFSLATASLGQLFFILTRRGDTAINITCHTENEQVTSQLTERTEELKQQVEALGFEQITIHWAALDYKLRKLQTEFTSPALLDRKV